MQIPAIIMAGGKSKRFDFDKIKVKYQEKSLLSIGGKYLIEYIIDALIASKNINRVIIAVSPHTPHTKSIITSKNQLIEIIETPGKGYHSDLLFIFKILKLGISMTVVADLPLIKPEIIDEIVEKYMLLKKPSLAVMTDFNFFCQHGIKPTIKFQSKNSQKNLVPIGINIIDGQFIEQKEQDQVIIVNNRRELIYNINTVDDYFQVKKYFNKTRRNQNKN
ncbi:MAG: NTP transferase domain-containing protein [Promethearchaeota archaeon]